MRMSRLAYGINVSPAGVSLIPEFSRTKSWAGMDPSSCFIWKLREGCATCRRSAARLKFPSSATATKYLRWRNSTASYILHQGPTQSQPYNQYLSYNQYRKPRRYLSLGVTLMLDGLVSVLFLMHVPHNQDCIAFSADHILTRSIKQHMTKVIAQCSLANVRLVLWKCLYPYSQHR